MKLINSPGDYYFCTQCNKWHKFTSGIKDLGTRHIIYFDKKNTNLKDANYYYCSYHRKWHSIDKTCLQFRLEVDVSKQIIEKYISLKQNFNAAKKQGSLTVQLGQKLHQWLSINVSSKKIIYDHGDRNLAEVGEVKSIMITDNNDEIELSDMDITIFDENDNISYVIEVEESSSTPKTILGDVFSLLFARKMRFHNIEHNFKNTVLIIIVGSYSEEVKFKLSNIIYKCEKINEILQKEKMSNNISKIELILLNSKHEIPEEGFEKVKELILRV